MIEELVLMFLVTYCFGMLLGGVREFSYALFCGFILLLVVATIITALHALTLPAAETEAAVDLPMIGASTLGWVAGFHAGRWYFGRLFEDVEVLG